MYAKSQLYYRFLRQVCQLFHFCQSQPQTPSFSSIHSLSLSFSTFLKSCYITCIVILSCFAIVPTASASIQQISAHLGNHSLLLTSDGHVYAWGYNHFGQLGNNSTTNRNVPVQVLGITSASQIAAGGYRYSLALLSNGTINAWGNNNFGQLGNNSTTSRSIPVQVSDITSASQIAAGFGHSLALLSDGTLKAWGYNYHSELGNNSTVEAHTPVDVDLSNLIDFSDVDSDGDGYTPNDGDCDDTSAAIYPSATEVCGDGIDQDCNGVDVECGPSTTVPDPDFTPGPIENPNVDITAEGTGSHYFLFIEGVAK